MNDKLTKSMNDLAEIGKKTNPFAKRGIGANIQQAEQKIRTIDPLTRPNRLGLVCDDSGSMSGEKIINAHLAVSNFTINCKPQETSICIYPLNADPKQLVCDFDVINMYWNSTPATGGTPLYTALKQLIEKENITRAVVFSDGDPTDSRLNTDETQAVGIFGWETTSNTNLAKDTIKQYQTKEIPIDTIFIGQADSTGYHEMKLIAKMTNGIFIHFTDSKSLTVNLKYLTPGLRGLLANPEIKEKIQRGEKL